MRAHCSSSTTRTVGAVAHSSQTSASTCSTPGGDQVGAVADGELAAQQPDDRHPPCVAQGLPHP